MKIKSTYDYLKYRAIVLSQKLTEQSEQYDENAIQMAEVHKKIKEIQSTVDEGLEMFSPKAAEERTFNNQEVNSLKMKLVLLAEEKKEIKKNMHKTEEELRIINNLSSEMSEAGTKTDRNLAEEKQIENTTVQNDNEEQKKETIDFDEQKQEYIQKIQFCSQIAEIDPRRVKIELKNLMEKYNQE